MQTRAKLADTDIAWAAGFVDGEGYIGITRDYNKKYKKTYYKVAVMASQIIPAPVMKLQSMFGGRVIHQKNSHKGCWHWRIFGEAAYAAIRTMLPYFLVKQEQAALVLQFGVITPSRNQFGRMMAVTAEIDSHRKELWSKVCTLNGGRALQADRLSEEAPRTGGGAIVGSHGNENHESVAEMTTPDTIN